MSSTKKVIVLLQLCVKNVIQKHEGTLLLQVRLKWQRDCREKTTTTHRHTTRELIQLNPAEGKFCFSYQSI